MANPISPLAGQPYTDTDKKLEYVRRLTQAVEALRISFDRIDDLITEAVALNYAVSITEQVLTDNEFDYLTPTLLIDAITQYNTLRAALTPTMIAAFLRIRP